MQKTKFSHGYALIVGVGADLPITIDDARGIQEILCDSDRGAYEVDHVKTLLSDKASRDDILSGLDQLAEYSTNDPEATVIVYFSGHGGMNPFFHLVPWGYNASDLARTAISGTEFTDKLRHINSKKLLVLLDCCHAGGMAEAKTTNFVKSPLPPEIDVILKSGSGRIVIASSRKDEDSLIGEPYSIFTQALREALSGAGAAEWDGFSYVADIAIYVGRMVPNRSNDTQHPILKMTGADNFPIGYYAGGELSPKALPQLEETIYPLDYLRADTATKYKKILYTYQQKLLVIEAQLADIITQSDIPKDLIHTKNLILKEIADIETQIKKDARQSGWQPVNVVANGKDAIAINAVNNSQILIRRQGSKPTNENLSPERHPSINPTPDASNIIASQDGSIAANATDQSKIEIDEN